MLTKIMKGGFSGLTEAHGDDNLSKGGKYFGCFSWMTERMFEYSSLVYGDIVFDVMKIKNENGVYLMHQARTAEKVYTLPS